MQEACPKCLMRFPHHLVIEARCEKRWRGANFDQASAEGNLGAALAHVWDINVKTQAGLEALYHHVLVRSYGERREVNPSTAYDSSTGEDFEFHVGLRETHDPTMLERIIKSASDAIAASRHFTVTNVRPPE